MQDDKLSPVSKGWLGCIAVPLALGGRVVLSARPSSDESPLSYPTLPDTTEDMSRPHLQLSGDGIGTKHCAQ